MNENQLRDLTEEIILLLLRKNEDYGGASFDLGLNGNMVHLWDKIKRYRNLIENNKIPNYESIEDTLKDIVGYGFIGLYMIRHKKM